MSAACAKGKDLPRRRTGVRRPRGAALCLFLLAATLLFPQRALAAEGTLTLSDVGSVHAGEALQITLTYSAQGMQAAEAEVAFGPQLTYRRCEGGEAYETEDGLKLSLTEATADVGVCTLHFYAEAAGETFVTVTTDHLRLTDGSEASVQTASVKVTVLEAQPSQQGAGAASKGQDAQENGGGTADTTDLPVWKQILTAAKRLAHWIAAAASLVWERARAFVASRTPMQAEVGILVLTVLVFLLVLWRGLRRK